MTVSVSKFIRLWGFSETNETLINSRRQIDWTDGEEISYEEKNYRKAEASTAIVYPSRRYLSTDRDIDDFLDNRIPHTSQGCKWVHSGFSSVTSCIPDHNPAQLLPHFTLLMLQCHLKQHNNLISMNKHNMHHNHHSDQWTIGNIDSEKKWTPNIGERWKVEGIEDHEMYIPRRLVLRT